jgi:hypothetical protein
MSPNAPGAEEADRPCDRRGNARVVVLFGDDADVLKPGH